MRPARLAGPIPAWPDAEDHGRIYPRWDPVLWLQIERHPTWTAAQHLELLHLLGTYGPSLDQVQELIDACLNP